MYIAPNSTIKLIKMCPLDSSYQNTILFDTPTAQTNYFINTLGGYTFQYNTYQRVNKGVIRVEKKADLLYDCNYLAFQNTAYGNKWFYGFIKKIEYVNNITSEVYYELDLIQTWQFNWVLEQCFVEREHSLTDEIGDNLIPEAFDTGEYICDDYIEPTESGSYYIVFWCTFARDQNDNWKDIGGSEFNQGYQTYYSGLTPTMFPLTTQGVSDAIDWLEDVPAILISGIVTATIMPAIGITALAKNITISKSSALKRLNNQTIKNKKCFTYPYNFLYVTNNQGQSAEYRYEFFSGTGCDFALFADTSPQSVCMLYPRNYKGLTDNLDERLEIKGYPQVGYNVDSYKAWLAQNLSSLGTSAALLGLGTDAIGSPTFLSSGTKALAPYGAAGSVAETGIIGGVSAAGAAGIAIPLAALCMKAVSGTIHAMMPPQARGQQGGNVMLARGKLNYGIIHKHITPEFATIIDDYFNMYGYATNKTKVPNMTTRPEWNYVKTIGCSIYGELPSDDAREIEGIFDRGIRFWHNASHIGNYSYDNSPSSL